MRNHTLALAVFAALTLFGAPAMSYTEFYCDPVAGDNLNAGSTQGAPIVSEIGGDWNQSTGVWSKAGADLSAVQVGMYASVCDDGAAAPAVFVGQITAVDDVAKTITVNLTIKAGTAPTTGSANRSIRIGGAWLGPNGASGFPINFRADGLGDNPRINYRNNAAYNVSAAIATAATAGMFTTHQGYAATPGDRGEATLDGGNTGASYVLLTGIAGSIFADWHFTRNGDSGSSHMVAANAANLWLRCRFSLARGANVIAMSRGIECESFSAVGNGFQISAAGTAIRCIAHDNGGDGFSVTSGHFFHCISDHNAGNGIATTTIPFTCVGCDVDANGASGILVTNAGATNWLAQCENTNFARNSRYAIEFAGTGPVAGLLQSCGFGTGTAANTLGNVGGNVRCLDIVAPIDYPANMLPWSGADSGDYRITLAQAKGTGVGRFKQTITVRGPYAGTVAYPDVGAAQTRATKVIIQVQE